MSLYKVGDVWYMYVVHNGRRIRRSTGYRDRKEAQRVHDQVKSKLWERKLDGRTWNDAVKEWLKAAPRDDADKYRLKALALDYSDRLIADVTAEGLEAAIAKRGPSPGTYNRYINLIKAILNLAKNKGWIDVVPHLARKKSAPSRLRWLTPDEWKRLHKELPDHLKPMATFALATGLRQKNVTMLEWSQVDMRRRVCWIHPDQAKARKPIGVPLSATAMAVLKAQKQAQDAVAEDDPNHKSRWVFPYRGKPIAKIKSAWGAALERAKVRNFTWHDLRHTWASWHVQAGTPLPVLKELGGWNTMQMVMRYAHLAPEHLRAYAGAVEENLGNKKRKKAA